MCTGKGGEREAEKGEGRNIRQKFSGFRDGSFYWWIPLAWGGNRDAERGRRGCKRGWQLWQKEGRLLEAEREAPLSSLGSIGRDK